MCALLNGEAGLKPVLKGRLMKTLLKAGLKPVLKGRLIEDAIKTI